MNPAQVPDMPDSSPPVATPIPRVVESPHGDRIDEYYWIRDDDAKSKRTEVIEYLVSKGAKIDQKDEFGQTAAGKTDRGNARPDQGG